MFSITPDRASIHRDEDSTVSERTETKRGARWNRWIFEELVVSAWTANLQFISDLVLRNEISLDRWSVWPLGGKEQGTLGVGILEAVFERIIADKLKLLPTIKGSLACVSDVLFAPQLDGSLEEALREASVVVMYPPDDRRKQLVQSSLKSAQIRYISQKEVRLALSALEKDLRLDDVSNSSRSVLLTYILSDDAYEDVGKCEACLLPMLDTSYLNFKPLPKDIALRFSQSAEELELFRECKAFMVDNSKLSAGALCHFRDQMHLLQNFTNVSRWDLEGARWYCIGWVFRKEILQAPSSGTICRPEIIGWVDRFWTWAISHDRNTAVSALDGLWLLPLTGNRYQSLPPRDTILDVSKRGQAASLFRDILACSTAASDYPIYTIDETMSQENADFFREVNLISDCEKPENIVKWIALFPDFLEVASYQQRTKLVGLLGALVTRRMTKAAKTCIQSLLHKLPLFHHAFDREVERYVFLHR
jgi:hypothetical protein